MPSWAAASANSLPETLSPEETKAVLQECAKSSAKLTLPSTSSSAFLKLLPPTFTVFGQSMSSSGLTPASSSASPEAILNTEPGAYWPLNARSQAAPPGSWLATARTWPSLGRIATTAAGFFAVAAALSAAAWMSTSRVVSRSSPSFDSKACRLVSFVFPPLSSVASPLAKTSTLPGPARRELKVFCSPVRPTMSPAMISPLDFSMSSALAGPAEPSVAWANPRERVRVWVSSVKRIPGRSWMALLTSL